MPKKNEVNIGFLDLESLINDVQLLLELTLDIEMQISANTNDKTLLITDLAEQKARELKAQYYSAYKNWQKVQKREEVSTSTKVITLDKTAS